MSKEIESKGISITGVLSIVQIFMFIFQLLGIIYLPWYLLLLPLWIILIGWFLTFLFIITFVLLILGIFGREGLDKLNDDLDNMEEDDEE